MKKHQQGRRSDRRRIFADAPYEAEVDFGEIAAWVGGSMVRLAMFVMRLSHSGRAFHLCLASEG